MRHAAKNGYDRIDIDLLVTKDGVIVATHTQDPMRDDPIFGGFKDPKGKLSKKKKINEMTWDQVNRLVHNDGYKIHNVKDIVSAAKSAGIQIQFELKASGRWQSKLPELAAILNEKKVKANIAIQTNKPKWQDTLNRASNLGFWARNISSSTWTAPKPDASLCKKLDT